MNMKLNDVILEARQVTLRFGGLVVLDQLDFCLRRGEIRALIGPNGAGKTSFFNIITGVYKPTRGKLYFDGRDITQLPAYKRTKLGIGRSFQLVNLFPELSVKKNIEIAVQSALKRRCHPFEIISRRKIEERTQEVLCQFRWIRDPLAETGTLIFGEQKKLETILAVISEPKLILLDEPTAGVDEEDIVSITELIKTMSAGRTILVTDHDIDFVMKVADMITVLNQGLIIAEAPPSEVANDPKVQKCYFGKANS